jgi:hypothetical protein
MYPKKYISAHKTTRCHSPDGFSVKDHRNENLELVEQRPVGEADSRSDDHDIPSLLWNRKVHCRVHKSRHRFLS